MKFSLTTAFLAATLAPAALAKTAHSEFPIIKRDRLSGKASDNSNSLTNAISNAISQNPVIIVLWSFAGGNAQTSTVSNTLTVTQTASVPAKAVATDKTVTTSAASAAATTTAAAKASGTQSSLTPGATHTVVVGGSQGLSYFPQSVNASVGDVIQFQFLSQNHTVTQSTFDNPCSPLAGGMNSGFMPNINNTVNPAPAMAMQVMTSDPLWMYCAQGNHCGRGMVFSINPTAAKTHAQFQAKAIATTGKGLTGSNLTGNSTAPGSAAASGAAGEKKGTATSVAAPSSVQTGVAIGTGTLQADGSCLCSVQCASGSFPVAAQGVGAFGGVAGSIKMTEMAGAVPVASRRLRRRFW